MNLTVKNENDETLIDNLEISEKELRAIEESEINFNKKKDEVIIKLHEGELNRIMSSLTTIIKNSYEIYLNLIDKNNNLVSTGKFFLFKLDIDFMIRMLDIIYGNEETVLTFSKLDNKLIIELTSNDIIDLTNLTNSISFVLNSIIDLNQYLKEEEIDINDFFVKLENLIHKEKILNLFLLIKNNKPILITNKGGAYEINKENPKLIIEVNLSE